MSKLVTKTETSIRPLPEPISVRIPEACRLTGIGRSKLYELIGDGRIDIVKVGAITLIPMESLRQLIRVATN